jgi:hypothetical protein
LLERGEGGEERRALLGREPRREGARGGDAVDEDREVLRPLLGGALGEGGAQVGELPLEEVHVELALPSPAGWAAPIGARVELAVDVPDHPSRVIRR